jgi:sodium/potassium-transporting ATPase subunit alpha
MTFASSLAYLSCSELNPSLSFRTLSIHVNDTIREGGAVRKGPEGAIRAINAHLIPLEEVCIRFFTSPILGLEHAAVQRRSKSGKNIISPPPTQYWKKALNYIFGGFNFLMWIAFIVTIVRQS